MEKEYKLKQTQEDSKQSIIEISETIKTPVTLFKLEEELANLDEQIQILNTRKATKEAEINIIKNLLK